MAQKKRGLFDASASESVRNSESPKASAKATSGVFAGRLEAVDLAGQRVSANQMKVDPAVCRLWPRHNRDYERLNEDRCRDLIESFRSKGAQDTPAIVRKLPDGDSHKYEIIAGARRFWTVNWIREHGQPEFPFFIEIRKLRDYDAFLLSHDENYARKDLSPYERAKDIKAALELYFDGNQAKMSEAMNKSKAWVSTFIELANLPTQIIDAYPDWDSLSLRHVGKLKKLLSDKTTRNSVLKRATELHQQHSLRASEKEEPMTGAEVLRALQEAAKTKKTSGRGGPIETYGSKDAPHLTLKTVNQSGLNFVVSKRAGASIDEIVDSFRKSLEQHYRS